MSLRAELYAGGRKVPTALDDLLYRLVMDQPLDVRARLAARLGGSRWAPHALVLALAQDEAPAAQAVLLRSPHLPDHQLMRLFAEGSLDHQSAIARRANLSPPLVEMIIQTGEPALLTALATNDRTEFSHDALRRLVEASRQHAALRTPLARHPRLTRDLAQTLSGWASEPLKRFLSARFTLHANAEPAELSEDADPEERVIDKLEKAGELRLGYLLEALREGHLPLFIAALARLGGFSTAQVCEAIDSDKPELLALACASIGIDRQVFPTILEQVRALAGGRPGGGEEGARRAGGAFAPFGAQVAARAFRRSLSGV